VVILGSEFGLVVPEDPGFEKELKDVEEANGLAGREEVENVLSLVRDSRFQK